MKLKITNNQQVWFTSDTHYSHKNICKGTSEWTEGKTAREFNDIDHMNSAIVDNINSFVKEDDILFHLGDWSFGGFDKIAEFRNRIVCKNIHLILGNHDHHIRRNRENVRDVFNSVNEYLMLSIHSTLHEKFTIIEQFALFHFPMCSWDSMKDKVIHLHGHLHSLPAFSVHQGKSMDVGIDSNPRFMSFSLQEIRAIMKHKPVANTNLLNDHHI